MIYAQEVRPGETAYMDDNGVTQMLLIDLDAPIKTLPGHEDKEIRIVMPRHSNEVPIIYTLNAERNEKEKAFDLLDVALHDETMKDMEKKIEKLEAEIERLEKEKAVIEYERRAI